MRYRSDIILQAAKLLLSGSLSYDCSIVIGDNAMGKSLLLKSVVAEKLKQEWDGIYFIDAVNRGFCAAQVPRRPERPEYIKNIMETRLEASYFNIRDSFDCYGTLVESAERIYSAFEKKVQDYFRELTGEQFSICYGDVLGEVDFGDRKGLLSSGFQAMIRLLLEAVYYEEMGMARRGKQRAMMVIDELDEFLSPRYASVILGFLRQHFPTVQFVVSTHSADLVASAREANVMILTAEHYEVLDAGDYATITDAQRLFRRVFGDLPAADQQMESELRRLFNNRLNHAWSESDEKMMEKLGQKELTASQKLIYEQIKKW